MNLYEVNPFKVFLKTKEELIKMGYEDNNDKDDFINVMAGRIVTITAESENGKIFTCDEFPNYAIYEYLIKEIYTYTRNVDGECSYAEIAKKFNVSTQSVYAAYKKAISKIKNINETSGLVAY